MASSSSSSTSCSGNSTRTMLNHGYTPSGVPIPHLDPSLHRRILDGWEVFYTAPVPSTNPLLHATRPVQRPPLLASHRQPELPGTPLALIISLLPPVTLSSIKMTRTFHSYKIGINNCNDWSTRRLPVPLIDPTVVQRYRSQGYNIFSNWTKSYYYVDIAYVLWGFWALLFLHSTYVLVVPSSTCSGDKCRSKRRS